MFILQLMVPANPPLRCRLLLRGVLLAVCLYAVRWSIVPAAAHARCPALHSTVCCSLVFNHCGLPHFLHTSPTSYRPFSAPVCSLVMV